MTTTPSGGDVESLIERVVTQELIEKAWADLVNCQEDRYFGNRSKLEKQQIVLRRFAAQLIHAAITSHDTAIVLSKYREALRPFGAAAQLFTSGVHNGGLESVQAFPTASEWRLAGSLFPELDGAVRKSKDQLRAALKEGAE